MTINGSTNHSLWTFKLEATEGTVSTASNTSQVTVTAYIGRTGSASYMTRPEASVVVGVTGCSSQTIKYAPGTTVNVAANAYVSLGSVTFTVPHDSDGSKTVTVTGKLTNDVNPTSGSASGSMPLTKIARATTPTVSASNVTLGNSVTISTPRASTAFTHTLKWKIGSATGTIASNVSTSYAWTPPVSLANYITSATSATCTITCETYQGTTPIGSKTLTITLTVPSTVVPTISSIVLSEADATMLKLNWGVYVQTKSKLKVKTTASGLYGSTISSYKITGIDSTTYSSAEFTSNALSTSGTRTITVTVTDSRGRTATKTTTYVCKAYSNPKISTAEIQRCNADGEINDDGIYLMYSFKGTISEVEGKNTTHIFQIAYKKTSDYTYTYKTLVDDYAINNENLILNGVIFENTSEYDFIFSATDSFNIPTTISKKLDTASDLLNFNASGKSMAIGKVSEASAEEKKLEIAMDTEVEGSLKLNGLEVLGFQVIREISD